MGYAVNLRSNAYAIYLKLGAANLVYLISINIRVVGYWVQLRQLALLEFRVTWTTRPLRWNCWPLILKPQNDKCNEFDFDNNTCLGIWLPILKIVFLRNPYHCWFSINKWSLNKSWWNILIHVNHKSCVVICVQTDFKPTERFVEIVWSINRSTVSPWDVRVHNFRRQTTY